MKLQAGDLVRAKLPYAGASVLGDDGVAQFAFQFKENEIALVINPYGWGGYIEIFARGQVAIASPHAIEKVP